MYTRHVFPLLNEALADTPVVLLNGARQTGKGTLAQSLSAENGRRYLTLDDHFTLATAKCSVVVGQRYSAPPRLNFVGYARKSPALTILTKGGFSLSALL